MAQIEKAAHWDFFLTVADVLTEQVPDLQAESEQHQRHSHGLIKCKAWVPCVLAGGAYMSSQM